MSDFLKLDQGLKETWVSALRGTAYVQAKSKLYQGTSENGQHHMCCLGVLEHLCGTPVEAFQSAGMPAMLDRPKGPIKVLSQSTPLHWKNKYSSVAHELANMNDEGKSFEEIALFIEENL